MCDMFLMELERSYGSGLLFYDPGKELHENLDSILDFLEIPNQSEL